MLSSQLLSRLNRELEMLERDPPPGIVCYPVNDNCTHLEAHIRGPIDSPFEDGTFKLDVQIPQRYPFDPPQIRFVTPIYHPNIDEAGRICADILKMPPAGSWKPALNLSTVLLALAGLMSYPNPDDPLEVDIATEFKENISVFRHKAKQSTLKYATNSPNSSSSKCSVSQNEIASLQKSETRSNRESQSSTIPEETCNESESAISRQRPPTSKKMSKLSLSKQKGVNHNQENSSNVQEINQVCDNKLNSEERVVVSKYLSTGSSNAVASPTKSSKTQVLSTRTDKHDMNPPISDINIAKEQELIPLAQITHSAPSKSVHSQCPERHKDRSKMIESLPVATSNEHMLKTELIEIIDVDEVTISPKENVSFSVGDDRKNEDTVNTPSQTTLVNITNSLHANTPKPESSTLRKRKLLSLALRAQMEERVVRVETPLIVKSNDKFDLKFHFTCGYSLLFNMSANIPKLETFELKLHATGVAEIIFNRPQRYNALSRQAYAEWLQAIQWAANCDEAKVTVLIGRGKYYTSGQELVMPEPMPESDDADLLTMVRKRSENTRQLVRELINFPKLLIVGVNGPAIGFGVTTLALADVVYSVPHATFKTPFMQLGFCAEGCSSALFPRIMGPSRANEMLLMGKQFSAEELEKCGFIGRILPAENFHEAVLKHATEAAQFSLGAIKTTKKLSRDVDREMLLKLNEEELDRLAERMISPESIESILNFVEQAQQKKAKAKQAAAKL